MKKILWLLCLLPVVALAQNTKITPMKATPAVVATPAAPAVPVGPDSPIFKFTEETWDFGSIPQGVPATHVFSYTNDGKEPLIVSQATASCGCTTPEWTKEPVLSGRTGTVKVTYNAAKEGSFNKTVTLLSNTGNPKYLTIKGTVLPKAAAPESVPANEEK